MNDQKQQLVKLFYQCEEDLALTRRMRLAAGLALETAKEAGEDTAELEMDLEAAEELVDYMLNTRRRTFDLALMGRFNVREIMKLAEQWDGGPMTDEERDGALALLLAIAANK